MNKKIILVLVSIIALGSLVLYGIWVGPSLFLKPPSEERIAFVSDRDGSTDIWTMRTDGTDARKVTNDPANDRLPTWSPSGAEIVSTSDRNEGKYQVFVSAWDGRYVQCLTTGTGTKDMPVWSRGGEEITFISSGKVYVIGRHSGNEEQYLPPPEIAGLEMSAPYSYAAWSPDHKYLLCVEDTDQGEAASAVELGDSPPTTEDHINPMMLSVAKYMDVAWTPSGMRIAAAFIDRDGWNGLSVCDLEMVQVKDILVTKGDQAGAVNPVWSPDGKRIAFEMWRVKDASMDRCVGVYVIDAAGGKPRRVMAGDAREPSWSPDGRMIVCSVIGKDGMRDIWKVNADGSDAVNITKGNGDNFSPAWSPAVKS